VTEEIMTEAALPDVPPDVPASEAERQASRFDHLRDLRKHETI
jgi:hypothetical protein